MQAGFLIPAEPYLLSHCLGQSPCLQIQMRIISGFCGSHVASMGFSVGIPSRKNKKQLKNGLYVFHESEIDRLNIYDS